MGFFERLEKLEDWLDKGMGEKIDMSEWDYADENTREYWTLLYDSNPAAFSQDQVRVIEAAFIYNYSLEVDEDGESVSPRIRTVNLMHPRYSVELLKTMSEAMKIGINLKTCSIQPHRWRPEVFKALNYGFEKNINILESSNNYIYPELIGIIDAKLKNIELRKVIPKHQYSETLIGEGMLQDMQSGRISEKICHKYAKYLNKENFFALYELTNIRDFMMLGGDPIELINKFCRNQHFYFMAYRDKKRNLITNSVELKEKKDRMAQYVKAFGLKRLEEKKVQHTFSASHKVEKEKIVDEQKSEQKKDKIQDTKFRHQDILDEMLKEYYIDNSEEEAEEAAAIKAEEERIMNLYR